MLARLFATVIYLALAGCMMPRFVPEATHLSAGPDEVVVIGKFELDPPINIDLEQKTHWNVVGDNMILNQLTMATGSTPEPITTVPINMREWQFSINANWGETFVVKMPRQRTFLKAAMVQLDVLNQDRLWFPGGYYFDVPYEAQAIYIGTLRYFRDDFNVILRSEIIDEFESMRSELKQRFSKTDEIQPALLKPLYLTNLPN